MARVKRTRLTGSLEFERVYRQGVAFRGKLFSVHAYTNELGTVRLGLSVSKKVGNAVTRNTVRRRLKEVFRLEAPKISSGLDLVISARPASADADLDELRAEFIRSLGKLGAFGVTGKVQDATGS